MSTSGRGPLHRSARRPRPRSLIIAACALMLVAVLAAWSFGRQGTDAPPVEAARPDDRIEVAFIGDSYTQGTPLGGLAEKRWTAQLARRLDPEFRLVSRVQAVSGSG